MLTVGDLFCGLGGQSCGAERAGMRPVVAVNHWEIAAATYERNHGIRPYRESLHEVDPESLPRVDVLLCSPSCTNHSRAKGGAPKDEMDRASGWQVVRFLRALKPSLLLVENVLEYTYWEDFPAWVAAIQDLGYGVNRDHNDRPGQVMDSSEWGVPQARRRWYMVGALGFEPTIQSPRLSSRPVRECIDWTLPMRRVDEGRPLAESTQARIQEARGRFGEEPSLLVFYGSGPQVASVDDPCRTVTTRDRFALYWQERIRMLQPHELQAVMGFPPTYQLLGTREQRIKMLGNACCPAVVAGILEQVA